jgi:PAS domain S-box-containing protein
VLFRSMRLIRWSGEAERVFGWRAEEVLGKCMEDFRWVYEEDQTQVSEVSADLTSGTNPLRFSYNRNYHKDGTVIHCEWYNSSLLDDSGHLRSILSLVLDITERKQAEAALKKAHDELEARIQERTAELTKINEDLTLEIAERLKMEQVLQESRNQLRALASQILSAQENERKRIGREVHDVLGSALSAIKFKIEHVIHQIDDLSTKDLIGNLENIVPPIKEAIEEVRRIQYDLRPPLLDDLGIVATLSWYCRRFETIYSAIKVDQTVTVQEEVIPEPLKITLFRIVQEALNNIAKYAKADSVFLGLRKVDNAIELSIRDNGEGFDPESLSSREGSKKGLGLSSMKERTEYAGGSFSIESAKGRGTIIRAVWPA